MSHKFPEMMSGAKPHMSSGKMTFTYLNSYGDVITETKPVLDPQQIKQHVMDRLHQFHDAGPGVRESETSRAIRKWISAHPKHLLVTAWNRMNDHGKMEMDMMFSKKSHYGISDPKWAKAHSEGREAIIGDNMVPL